MTRDMVWFLILAFVLGLASGLWRSRRSGLALREVLIATGWALFILALGTTGVLMAQIAARFASSSPVTTRELAAGVPVFLATWVIAVGAWALVPIVAGCALGLAWQFFARRSA